MDLFFRNSVLFINFNNGHRVPLPPLIFHTGLFWVSDGVAVGEITVLLCRSGRSYD